jgi:paraquat-inducible protein B
VVAVTSGLLFTQWRTWVVFLRGGASGLREGSPVTMRGVQIGQVKEIELFFTGEGHQIGIMVVIQIRRGSVKTLKGHARVASLSDAEVVKEQVAEGLRAEVRSTSPIGGQKVIDLDFHPDRPPRFSNIETPWPEVPTAPTGMEMLGERLEQTLARISEMPIGDVVTQIKDTLKSAQKLFDSGDLRGAIGNLRTALATANQTLASAEKTMANVNSLAADTRTTMAGANDTMKTMKTTVDGINRTLETVERNVERTADTQLEAAQTLDEMRELMKSLRFLIDTLQQHPEALLQGKPKPEEKR